MRQKLSGTFTVCRQSNGEFVTVTLRDENSRINFAVAEIRLTDFSKALFGLAEVPAEVTVNELQHIGKKKEHRSRTIRIPAKVLKKAKVSQYHVGQLEAYVENNYQHKGWILNSSLRSQGSHTYEGDVSVLKVSYHRFV